MSENDSSSGSVLPPPPPPPPPPSNLGGEEIPPEIGGAPLMWDDKPKGKPKAKRGTGRSLTWFEVWKLVLTEPREESFHTILNDPQATTNRAYTWIFVTALITIVLWIAGDSLSPENFFMLNINDQSTDLNLSPICGVFFLPVGAALAIVVAIIISGIQHFTANALGGGGDFNAMVYSYAAIVSPLSIIAATVNMVPVVGCVGFFVWLYVLALNVIAVKTVYGLDIGRSIITVFWWVGVLCLCAIMVAAFVILVVVGSVSGS